MSAIVIGIGKVIVAIPLWLTGLAGKGLLKALAGAVRFLAELIGILAFKARWWIVSIFWLFVLYGLVKAEPTIRDRLPQPVYAIYIRFIIVLMGLMLLAYVTKNLRRAFRRARLEVKVLNTVGAGGLVGGNNNSKKKGSNTSTSGNTSAAKTSFIARIVAAMRSSSESKESTVIDATLEHEIDPDEPYEVTAARTIAEENAHVQTGTTGGQFKQKERPDWMKAKPKKSGRASSKDSTGVDPWARLIAVEEQAKNLRQAAQSAGRGGGQGLNINVGDNLEFDAGLLQLGQQRISGKVVRMVNDPVTGTPTPIVEFGGQEYVVGSNTTIYNHWT